MPDIEKYDDEIPGPRVILRWIAGYPDKEQLIENISRSYSYIQNLSLEGICEGYPEDDQVGD